MILLVDNNDSFTYNIVDLLNRISAEKLEVVKSNDLDLLSVSSYQYIIISPGSLLPKNYPILRELIAQNIGKKPILGICLGCQAICEYLGSELKNYQIPFHGVESLITCDSQSVLFQGVEEMVVGRYHSWVVKDVSNQLQVVARDKQGDIMAVENPKLKIFGVQFHPESYITQNGSLVLKNFLNEKVG